MRAHFFDRVNPTQIVVASMAMLATLLVVQPIVAQARTVARKPSAFRQDAAFLMYAADVDGGFADFQGKPILLDGLGLTLARYGSRPVACAAKKGGATGCKPIVRFEADKTVVESGSTTSWTGTVANATSSSCTIQPTVYDDPVLAVPGGSIPVPANGVFWLITGAMGEGVGTVGVQTNTGAFAEDSVLVLE